MIDYIITFKEEVDKELLESINAENITTFKYMTKIATCSLDDEGYSAINESDKVESIEVDKSDAFNEDTATFDFENSEKTYAYDFMNIKEFHNEGITGKGVKVAVLDTGTQKHKNLKISGGINTYDETLPYDSNLASYHGTKVAGIIASQGVEGSLIGIAPGVELYAVRIDDGSGALNRTIWSSQIKAIEWCIDNNIDAINCSFSSTTDSKARRDAFKIAYDRGIAIFCSAGNTQPTGDTESTHVDFPSKYPFVVTSANITPEKVRNENSSIGRGVNFSNGGTMVKSTTIDGDNAISNKFERGTGTSYASPATLGIYALYKEKYGESRDKILERMYVNVEKLGNYKEYGAGIPKYPTNEYNNIQMKG